MDAKWWVRKLWSASCYCYSDDQGRNASDCQDCTEKVVHGAVAEAEKRIAALEKDKMALHLAINERMEHDRERIAALEAELEQVVQERDSLEDTLRYRPQDLEHQPECQFRRSRGLLDCNCPIGSP